MSAIRNYARALFAEAKQGKRETEVMEQLNQIVAAIVQVEGYKEFFSSPMVTQEQKSMVLASLKDSKILPELFQLLNIMVTNGRIAEIAELGREYHQFLDESTGVLRGKVVSATPLADKTKNEITDKMTQMFKKKIIFNYIQDENILGGTKVEIAGMTFDDSLSAHLNRMSENLNRSSI